MIAYIAFVSLVTYTIFVSLVYFKKGETLERYIKQLVSVLNIRITRMDTSFDSRLRDMESELGGRVTKLDLTFSKRHRDMGAELDTLHRLVKLLNSDVAEIKKEQQANVMGSMIDAGYIVKKANGETMLITGMTALFAFVDTATTPSELKQATEAMEYLMEVKHNSINKNK